MLNGNQKLILTYKDKELEYENAHIYHTEEKSVHDDGLTLKNSLKVRVPYYGGVSAPPVGARTVFKNRVYTVLLTRENFKGKNPHIYLELQS